MSLLTVIWITSSSIFSLGVSLRGFFGNLICANFYNIARMLCAIGTFRSDYDYEYEYEYEYEFFNVYPVRMPDCVRLSRQLVLSSKSRRRLDTNYEIFNKSRPPTTSSLQVQRRVKRLVFKRSDAL